MSDIEGERRRAAWCARELIIARIRELYPVEFAQAEREIDEEQRKKDKRIRIRLPGDPPKGKKPR